MSSQSNTRWNILVGLAAVGSVGVASYLLRKMMSSSRGTGTPNPEDLASGTVSQIAVFPLKGAAGFTVSSWPVTQLGLQYDRDWIVIDANEQRVLPGTEFPELVLCRAAMDLAKEIIVFEDHTKKLSQMKPLTLSTRHPATGDITVLPKVARSGVNGDVYEVSKEASQWFSDVFGRPLMLVRRHRARLPIERTDYEGSGATPDDKISYQAFGHFLIQTQDGIDWLHQRIPRSPGEAPLTITAETLRANIIVSGVPHPQDDHWKGVTIEAGAPPASGAKERQLLKLHLGKHCTRCPVPCIDLETGKFHPRNEPTRTIKEHRNAIHPFAVGRKKGDQVGGPMFGGQWLLDAKKGSNDDAVIGILFAGAKVVVTETKPAPVFTTAA